MFETIKKSFGEDSHEDAGGGAGKEQDGKIGKGCGAAKNKAGRKELGRVVGCASAGAHADGGKEIQSDQKQHDKEA